MKTFVAIYMGTQEALKRGLWTELSEDERKARVAKGMQAWMEWGKTHAAAIVDHGGPLGKTKRVAPEGVGDIKNTSLRSDAEPASRDAADPVRSRGRR